ncbi:hypothetical protein HPP92_004583 [Vanilla planifolia]|uniref:Pentatricopeptide repeat-containing protein n=1 Tax=Vanilla planifolia TaxID=51239 RepID=A0A835SAD4_VANPL|nr:hypothetical protein HPP92_004583 [Vanilla planifolia]
MLGLVGKQSYIIVKSAFASCNPRVMATSCYWSPPSGCAILNAWLDIHSCNRMIIDFSNAGDLISARTLFDRMPERDVVSWNSIMTGYARNASYEEVVQMFVEMLRSKLKPSHTSFSVVLTSCAKVRALDLGKQIHGLSIKKQSAANVFVGSCLITMYSRCSATDCLVWAFQDIDYPNTSSWNALISGFVLNHEVCNAQAVFDKMPCRNVVSWTAMIVGYVEANKIREAIQLFEAMPVKNHVSWSVMLGGLKNCGLFGEALDLFSKMLSDGVRTTISPLLHVINACSLLGDLQRGCKIHGFIIKLGFHLDYMIEASLVSMYCECLEMDEAELQFRKMDMKYIASWNSLLCGFIKSSKLNDARNVFDSMDCRDNVTWNSMVNGYLKHKKLDEAMNLFWEMPEPDMETITSLMFGFIQIGNLEIAEKLFHTMPERDVVAHTALLFGYVESDQLDKATKLFNEMAERNVVSYNVMICGLLRHGKTKDAYDLFKKSPVKDSVSWYSMVTGFVDNGLYLQAIQLYKKMVLWDIKPRELVTSSLLRACAKLSILNSGEQFHGVAIKLGHQSCLIVGNSLINMYGKCGNMEIVKYLFNQMVDPDIVTWNAIIHSYACNGFAKEAMVMFEKMKMGKIKPDFITFLGILFACNHCCLVEEAQHYFNEMIRVYAIKPSLAHFACLIDLLCRMGMAEAAAELAYSMPFEPDSAVWTSILSGCRLHSNVKLAEYAANQLFSWDPLDRMPYLHLISIYKTAGSLSEIEFMRSKMDELKSNHRPGCSWI